MATDFRAAVLDGGAWLGPKDAGQPVSADAFASSAFETPRMYERESGRLVVRSPNSEDHDNGAEPIRDHLGAYRLAHHERVPEVVSEAWIRVDPGTDRIADLAVYLFPELPVPDRPDRGPDLISEVVSPDRVPREWDSVSKRRESLALGVREWILVDRMRNRFTVPERGPACIVKRILRPGDLWTSVRLSGLGIPIADILGD